MNFAPASSPHRVQKASAKCSPIPGGHALCIWQCLYIYNAGFLDEGTHVSPTMLELDALPTNKFCSSFELLALGILCVLQHLWRMLGASGMICTSNG